MARTNIDIDDDLVAKVMHRFGVRTKREAVDLALRRVALEPMTAAEVLGQQGTGWEGDLGAMRDQEPAGA